MRVTVCYGSFAQAKEYKIFTKKKKGIKVNGLILVEANDAGHKRMLIRIDLLRFNLVSE